MTSEELMLAYALGDAKAFEVLFDLYKHRIFGYVAKNLKSVAEREDIAQAIFLKLHQSKEKYSDKYPFEAWLFVIARSVLYDHLRKNRHVTLEELKDFMVGGPEEERETPEVNLNALDERAKKVMELRYLEEKSFDEIASIVNATSSNIRQIVARSLKFLRKNRGENL